MILIYDKNTRYIKTMVLPQQNISLVLSNWSDVDIIEIDTNLLPFQLINSKLDDDNNIVPL
jgi:hypothetical protein